MGYIKIRPIATISTFILWWQFFICLRSYFGDSLGNCSIPVCMISSSFWDNTIQTCVLGYPANKSRSILAPGILSSGICPLYKSRLTWFGVFDFVFLYSEIVIKCCSKWSPKYVLCVWHDSGCLRFLLLVYHRLW